MQSLKGRLRFLDKPTAAMLPADVRASLQAPRATATHHVPAVEVGEELADQLHLNVANASLAFQQGLIPRQIPFGNSRLNLF
jgi:hypothetical protein